MILEGANAKAIARPGRLGMDIEDVPVGWTDAIALAKREEQSRSRWDFDKPVRKMNQLDIWLVNLQLVK